jgi:HTH-type transcriptional regulator/antitoxin HigA
MHQFLMEEHGLSEADLPEIGSSDAVAAYLAGKKDLSVGQVRALAQRFRVTTAAFV